MQLLRFARILNPHTAKVSSKLLKDHNPPKSVASEIEKDWELYVEIVDQMQAVDMSKFDLIHWWSLHKLRLPNMYNAARWMLSVPCSTCDVERSFSKYKEILAPNRRNMCVETVKCQNALYFNRHIPDANLEGEIENEVRVENVRVENVGAENDVELDGVEMLPLDLLNDDVADKEDENDRDENNDDQIDIEN